MARSAQAEGAAGRGDWRRRCSAGARQQLRVHPADPDALQRADLRRARRRRGQGVSATISTQLAASRRARSRASLRHRRRRGRARSSRSPACRCCRSRPTAIALARYGLNVADVQDVGRASRSAARRPDRCSRATGASTSSCACPKSMRAAMLGRDSAACRCRCCPRTRRTATVAPRLRAARRVATIDVDDRAQPDQPRERQAPRGRHRQRARPRPRLVRRPRCRARVAREVEAAGRLLGRLWRHVRAADLGRAAPAARRAAGAAADLRPAVHAVRLVRRTRRSSSPACRWR